jgi:hypothetical protein
MISQSVIIFAEVTAGGLVSINEAIGWLTAIVTLSGASLSRPASQPCRFVGVTYRGVVSDHVIFEVFTALTMKNVVFWDIKIQFVLHRRHITSPLQSPAS